MHCEAGTSAFLTPQPPLAAIIKQKSSLAVTLGANMLKAMFRHASQPLPAAVGVACTYTAKQMLHQHTAVLPSSHSLPYSCAWSRRDIKAHCPLQGGVPVPVGLTQAVLPTWSSKCRGLVTYAHQCHQTSIAGTSLAFTARH